MQHRDEVIALLAEAGIRVDPAVAPRAQRGGDISAAWHLCTSEGELFVKTAAAAAIDMFTAERDALLALAHAAEVRVPRPLVAARGATVSLLALEWLVLEQPAAATHREFGRQLAALHRHAAEQHGWHRDNTIGATPQPNPSTANWTEFFREERLSHQLRLAQQHGYGGELQQQGRWLCDHLEALFRDYTPQPSLLHGDLWGGNWAACDGQPVMFDPATYYGDRETDLAMTRLFGGFQPGFYAAYEECWPCAAGAAERTGLYQLYHVLNHLNLFGSGYLAQALSLMAKLRRAIERGS